MENFHYTPGIDEANKIVASYTTRALQRVTVTYGPPPAWIDDEDLIQDVHVLLFSQLGGDYLELIHAARGHDFKKSAACRSMRRAFARAFSAAQSKYAKRKERGLPDEVTTSFACRSSSDQAKGQLAEPADCRREPDALLAIRRLVHPSLAPPPLPTSVVNMAMDLRRQFESMSVTERHVMLRVMEGATLKAVAKEMWIPVRRVTAIVKKFVWLMRAVMPESCLNSQSATATYAV